MAKRVTLLFEDFPDTPVEVTLSPVPMRAFFDFVERWAQTSTTDDVREAVADFTPLAQPSLSDGLVLEDLDYGLLRATINEWARQVRDAPLPLLLDHSAPQRSPARSSGTPGGRRKSPRSS